VRKRIAPYPGTVALIGGSSCSLYANFFPRFFVAAKVPILLHGLTGIIFFLRIGSLRRRMQGVAGVLSNDRPAPPQAQEVDPVGREAPSGAGRGAPVAPAPGSAFRGCLALRPRARPGTASMGSGDPGHYPPQQTTPGLSSFSWTAPTTPRPMGRPPPPPAATRIASPSRTGGRDLPSRARSGRSPAAAFPCRPKDTDTDGPNRARRLPEPTAGQLVRLPGGTFILGEGFLPGRQRVWRGRAHFLSGPR